MDRIVVGVDGSPHADRALAWAITEAELHGATLELLHAHVIHPYASVFGDTDRELAQSRLDDVVERSRDQLDRVTWSSTLLDAAGVAAAALIDGADGADLMVVGSRGIGGFSRLRLGSTSYRTAAHAPLPVAVVPGTGSEDDGRRDLVVGVDHSPVARRALRWALEEAGRRSVDVTAVHCYQLPVDPSPLGALNQKLYEKARQQAHDEAAALLDDVVDVARVPDGVTVRRVITVGPPAGVLLEHGSGQILVTGTRGQGTFSRAVFGSVSQQVLRHAGGPVVIVP